jgi:tetratricopeptide (TPR) repeat protein
MAKAMGSRRRPPNAILLADLPNQPGFSSTEEFQVSSWALVSFLLNGGRDYFRTLTEIFMLLSPDASAAENSEAVARRFSLWNDFETTARDFGNYLSSRKTFKELMDDGQSAYSMGNFMSAELSFMAAMDQRPSDYAPYYYLGLLFYEGRDYAAAEQYYLASEERGADAALINYALGINAVSAGRYDDAAGYLRKAAALDPARYRTRVEDTLRRIGR